jgi:predicted Zn-dependent protease
MSSQSTGPTGSIAVAVEHASRLLERNPALAASQAEEILRAAPGHPLALLVLGAAQRLRGDAARALDVLTPLVEREPKAPAAWYEYGLALGAAGRGTDAIAALRRAVDLKPGYADAWRALGDHALATGDVRMADDAYARHLRFSARDPRVVEAAIALLDNRLAHAETLLRAYLDDKPADVAALRMLAELASRLGRYGDAERLLVRCLELAPGFRAARHNLAYVLHRQNQYTRALAELDALLRDDPRNPSYRNLKAVVLSRTGDVDESIRLFDGVLAEYPKQPRIWLSYGHVLKTAGRQSDGVAAYRRSLDLAPGLGEAWWSLANLKTWRFAPEDVETMRRALGRDDLTNEDRYHLEFALGKALEDAGDYARSFDHYARGNGLRRKEITYDPGDTSDQVARGRQVFTAEFFSARAGWGAEAPDPIFIVGLPRAGSTLVEQILASHPLVEGTQELPDIPALARRLGGRKLRSAPNAYPEIVASLDEDRCRELGEQYLNDTRIQRKTNRPFFVDKMPNNWLHVGLIRLILPNARIIDARRHPLGCCLSGFKQHFARGQHFTYDLADVGHYYRDYVTFMAHVDAVLPGAVHRVIYEAMVADTETEVRRLLDYCGLPFDEKCLEFHRTERAVRTASSEQVRQPIFRDAVEHWQHYDPWLGPLREALGPVVDAYPQAPPL